jgi:hypothetical protein
MTALQKAYIAECPVREEVFRSSVKNLVVATAVKHFLDTGEAVNMVNRAGVKKFLMEWAKHTRHHPFNRIASYVPAEVNAKVRHTLQTMLRLKSLKAAVEELERVARQKCYEVVRRNPSSGRTLR